MECILIQTEKKIQVPGRRIHTRIQCSSSAAASSRWGPAWPSSRLSLCVYCFLWPRPSRLDTQPPISVHFKADAACQASFRAAPVPANRSCGFPSVCARQAPPRARPSLASAVHGLHPTPAPSFHAATRTCGASTASACLRRPRPRPRHVLLQEKRVRPVAVRAVGRLGVCR